MKQLSDKPLSLPATTGGGSSQKTGRIKYQLMGCFLTIALVTLGVGLVLMISSSGHSVWGGGIGTMDAAMPEAALRWRIALGMVLIIGTTGLVFGFLVRRIADPLVKSDHAAERMADGHLGVTLPTTAPNEIGRIGENVNGLVVNFQEVLTLVWNQTETAITRLRRSTGRTPSGQTVGLAPETIADLTSAQQELETMRTMVRAFDLYDVTITANDQLAAKEEVETYN